MMTRLRNIRFSRSINGNQVYAVNIAVMGLILQQIQIRKW